VSGRIMVEPASTTAGSRSSARHPGTRSTSDNVITGQVTVVAGTLALNKDRSGSATAAAFNGAL